MKHIARTLELSLAAHSPSASESFRAHRKSEIEKIPGTVERSVVRGLDTFAAKKRKAATTTLSGLSRIVGGVSYVGNGAFSSVYKRSDMVLKIYRHTALMDEADKEAFRAERAQMCESLRDHLGSLVAKQTLVVGEHPLGNYRVVLAQQPFVAGAGLDLFATNTFKLNRPDITDYCERQVSGGAQLKDLVEKTFATSDDQGLVPDINGVDNFRLVGPGEQLRLIDAEPISRTEHAGVHDHILKQAETLGTFLSTA